MALISLDEEISKDISLVLFDEYDAPLNPSLTEALYHVIEKFYINKGIQVIITTHSPATISLAPEYTQFYEIFNQDNSSPKIVSVNQYDYDELKKTNKLFYDKIKNQDERINELEKVLESSGNMLLVEDKYDQIYKIAYLKLKGISDLTETDIDQKFTDNSNFTIHGSYSTGGLYNVLSCPNISRDKESNIICLFDYDKEGYEKFDKITGLKNGSEGKIYSQKQGSRETGFFVKHLKINKFALLLPVPDRLSKYVTSKSSSYCFIEIESLLSEEYLRTNPKAELCSDALEFYKMKDKYKNEFWKDLLDVDPIHFEDFRPLFDQIAKIFNDYEVSTNT